MFDAQPVLKGDLVELRPLRSGDYDDLFAVAADPLIWERHPVKSRSEVEGFQRPVEKIGAVLVGSRSDAGRESYVYQLTASAFAQRQT